MRYFARRADRARSKCSPAMFPVPAVAYWLDNRRARPFATRSLAREVLGGLRRRLDD
jgi:hypothetical protein